MPLSWNEIRHHTSQVRLGDSNYPWPEAVSESPRTAMLAARAEPLSSVGDDVRSLKSKKKWESLSLVTSPPTNKKAGLAEVYDPLVAVARLKRRTARN